MGGWWRFWHEKGRLSVKSDIWCPKSIKDGKVTNSGQSPFLRLPYAGSAVKGQVWDYWLEEIKWQYRTLTFQHRSLLIFWEKKRRLCSSAQKNIPRKSLIIQTKFVSLGIGCIQGGNKIRVVASFKISCKEKIEAMAFLKREIQKFLKPNIWFVYESIWKEGLGVGLVEWQAMPPHARCTHGIQRVFPGSCKSYFSASCILYFLIFLSLIVRLTWIIMKSWNQAAADDSGRCLQKTLFVWNYELRTVYDFLKNSLQGIFFFITVRWSRNWTGLR